TSLSATKKKTLSFNLVISKKTLQFSFQIYI
ncbi:MAG: hypothetical protein ACI8VI_001486, partial [Granulosicoccus sp.]